MKKLLILIPLSLLGCNVERRQLDKLDAYAVKFPTEMQILANRLYPCFSGKAKSDTVIKTHTDTLIQDGVTTTVRVKDTVYVTKTLQGRIITNTRTLSIHDTVKDQRSENVINIGLKLKADSLLIVKTQMSQAQKSKTTWMWLAIGLMVLIGVFLTIKIYTLVSGGAMKLIG